jgi:hypothetical protein
MRRFIAALALVGILCLAVVPAEAKGPKGGGGPKGNNGNHYGWYKGGGPYNAYRAYAYPPGYSSGYAPYSYSYGNYLNGYGPYYSGYGPSFSGYSPWTGYGWYGY